MATAETPFHRIKKEMLDEDRRVAEQLEAEGNTEMAQDLRNRIALLEPIDQPQIFAGTYLRLNDLSVYDIPHSELWSPA